MDIITKNAIEKSILHWEDNLIASKTGKREKISISWKNCALCRIFLLTNTLSGCCNCPIYKKTGKANCENTPYAEVSDALNTNESDEYLIKVIQKELDFLKSLLP